MLAATAVAHATDNDLVTLQASSTVAITDNRIATLWSVIPSWDDLNDKRVRRDCTASYIGNIFWLTAHHCVSSSPFMDGFLQ
ncbi:hypothetical protein FRC0190_00425 [Corynebacterium rouxii]|uniref:Serine protease n=1 Tax=Corynebacterium rouxii TaxID=2719119 RepID=A0A6I8MA35_9CORY|nr:hypothetical protein FRC0190_00425 [Corynebacterium rouxii]